MNKQAENWLEILNDQQDRPIFREPNREYTLFQLRAQISRLRSMISNSPFHKWALYDSHGFHFLSGLFALLSAGRKVLIPNSPSQLLEELSPAEDVGYMGNASTLAPRRERRKVDVEIPRKVFEPSASDGVKLESRSGWGEIIFYTSGSTAKPKLVTKTIDQLYFEADLLYRRWSLSSRLIFVSLVNHHHMYGFSFALMLPTRARASVYLPRNQGLMGVVEPLELSAPSTDGVVVIASPTVARQSEKIASLAEPGSLVADNKPARNVRVISAGSYMSATNADKMMKLFDCPVTEVFGSTETGAIATRRHDLTRRQHSHSWRLLPGIKASTSGKQVVDDGAAGFQGELRVWGGHTGGSPDNPVRLGDIVKMVAPDRFIVTDKNTRIYKIEGRRIAMNEIIEKLEACEWVEEAVALPIRKNNRDLLVCGVLLSEKGKSLYRRRGRSTTNESIRKYLRRLVDPMFVPRIIRYLDFSPRTEFGKLTYQALSRRLSNFELPELPFVEQRFTAPQKFNLALSVPMELKYLRGHFDTRPIVPGFILLHWAHHFIKSYWALTVDTSVVESLKLSATVAPGDQLTFTLRIGERDLEFNYLDLDKKVVAKGTIPLTKGGP